MILGDSVRLYELTVGVLDVETEDWESVRVTPLAVTVPTLGLALLTVGLNVAVQVGENDGDGAKEAESVLLCDKVSDGDTLHREGDGDWVLAVGVGVALRLCSADAVPVMDIELVTVWLGEKLRLRIGL